MTDARRDAETAGRWQARLKGPAALAVDSLPAGHDAGAALALLIAAALAEQRGVLVVTADDAGLPPIANALDIAVRPLCLVLPAAGQIMPIALRASLSLLKSRLTRADDSGDRLWGQQRRRLALVDGEWRQSLAWCHEAAETEPQPAALLRVFPALVLPCRLAQVWSASAEWVIVVNAPSFVDSQQAWPGAQRTLVLNQGGSNAFAMPIVGDQQAGQRAEIDLLTQEVVDLELELATAQAEIADFSDRYHTLIGARIARLDAVQAELASRQLAANTDDIEAARRADLAQERAWRSRQEHERFKERDRNHAGPFRADADLKKLFRSLAQKIHPDRARDDADRSWRTQLMSEANRAYRANDRHALEEILALWAEGAQPSGAPAAAATEYELAHLKRRIGEIEAELNRLFASRLYELFTAAGIARRAGRDLLQEMAERLDADILLAETQLAR
jgi:sRNA-binding protein